MNRGIEEKGKCISLFSFEMRDRGFSQTLDNRLASLSEG